MERSDHAQAIEQAFTSQARSFNASAMANASGILDGLVEAARPKSGERWLEAACGPGIVSRRFARHAESVVGIDATAAMIQIARREAAATGLENVSFEVGDATATALPAESFDGAVTRFSIHHIPVPARLFAELARVVRPGARIAVMDHLADDDAEARAWTQEMERLRDPSHWASVSARRLLELGRQAGLELVEQRCFAFELDFDDWLRRGTEDESAHALVERRLADRPAGSPCFQVRSTSTGRVLQLQMWLGVWRG